MFGVTGDVNKMILGSFEPDYDNLDNDTVTAGPLSPQKSPTATPAFAMMPGRNPDGVDTSAIANNGAQRARSDSPGSMRQRLSGRNDARSNSRRREIAEKTTAPD